MISELEVVGGKKSATALQSLTESGAVPLLNEATESGVQQEDTSSSPLTHHPLVSVAGGEIFAQRATVNASARIATEHSNDADEDAFENPLDGELLSLLAENWQTEIAS